MAKEEIIIGLDIGSSKVTAISAVKDETGRYPKIIGAVIQDCADGIKSGSVINIAETSYAVKALCLSLKNKRTAKLKMLL